MKEFRVVSELALQRRTKRHAAIGVALLAALLLLVSAPSRPAAAQPARGEVAATVDNGFARLVFTLPENVDTQVKAANGIIIMTFQRPVDIAVDKLAAGAPGFITAARRDPDGKGVRIALGRKVTVNSTAAAERLFVDLLPDPWTGPIPGLPREVIEDISRRLRAADTRMQDQRAAAGPNKAPAIRVRIATQPTFTRYLFELPEPTAVAADSGKDKLTLTFDRAFKFDLADARAALPPVVGAVDSDVGRDTAVVRFTFAGKVDVRTFREESAFIVDVTPMDARGDRPEASAKSDQLSKIAAELTAKMNAPAGLEAPQTVPAPATAVPEPKPAVAQAADAPPPVPESLTRNPVADPIPQVAPAAPVLPAAPTAPTPQVAPTAPAATPARESGIGMETPSAQMGKDAHAPAASSPAFAAQGALPPEADELMRAAEADNPKYETVVMAAYKRQGDNLSLLFPFAAPTPAAVFSRADTLWLVFDTSASIGLGKLEGEPSGTVKSASTTRGSDGVAVVRIKLERPRLVSATTDGPVWAITLGNEVIEPTRPLAISRNVIGSAHASIIVPFDDPRGPHRIEDPEAGDTLLVMTALAPARGFVKSQDFVEFRALASTHGVVVQPLADDLNAQIAFDKIVISRPSGLTLSAASSGGARASGEAAYQPHVVDTPVWSFDRQADFEERSTQLVRAAASASGQKRSAARADLARFYLARNMGAEAKGVLDVAMADNPPTAEDPSPLVLRAIANIMMGRLESALKDLGDPLVGNQYDAQLWRALVHARQGRWSDAREGFRAVGAATETLPVELQRIMLKDMVRTSIEVGDTAAAASQMHDLEAIGIPPEFEATVAVLNGRIAEGLGRKADALRDYMAAAASPDRPAAAQGRLRELVLQHSLGKLDRSEAIAALETLTSVWRGDDTEIEALQLLAQLYTADGRYRDAFHLMRTALAAHSNSELTRRIHEEAAETFDSLFLADKADTLPAIDALTLFYDFRELTPIGRRGDEMIRRLADRLVSVDLLAQAAELLQHQVDHRLEGAARAQVATRLAAIYLMNRKPDRALAALRMTRTANLPNDLRNQRLLLEARSLSDLGRHDLALEVVADITGRETVRLRSDILWASQRWRAAAEQIELLYGDRWRDFEPLAKAERRDILRAGIGYVLGEDAIGVGRLRDRYVGKMEDGPDRRAFDVVTAPIEPKGTEFREIARSIAAADTLDAFLRDLRARYPDVGGPPAAQNKRAPDPSATGTVTLPRPARQPESSPLPPALATMPRLSDGRAPAR